MPENSKVTSCLARLDNSKGQPDASRLEKARAFARGTMGNFNL